MFLVINSAWHGLTHWGWVTHICVSDLINIGSDNGLSPGWRRAIIRTNAGILLIRPLRYVHTCAGGRGRRRAENWLQHKSLHVFTHARSRSGGGAGAKSAPLEMGPTPNLPRPLRNRALQTIIVLNKWQIRLLRVCVNIPAVAEWECQNPPASAPQPPRACVNVALGTNFSEYLVEILIFSFKKMCLKVSSAKRRLFCLGLNELIQCALVML